MDFNHYCMVNRNGLCEFYYKNEKTETEQKHSYEFQIKVSLLTYDYSMPLIMKVLFCRYMVNEIEISFSSICHVVLHNRERLFPFSFTQNRVMFNPLTLRSYQHETSPNKILTLSSKQLMRIFKLIR